MRASRLLRVLLLLQNRGRLTTLELATELEVARRTVMRDVDALTEAGLPIVVHRGKAGGVELGFNYRSRLAGLDAEEAEALGLVLALPKTPLAALGMEATAQRACARLVESLPELVRLRIGDAQRRFQFAKDDTGGATDPRVPALAAAIRDGAIVRIHAKSGAPRTVHPIALEFRSGQWALVNGLDPGTPIPVSQCGDINISARRFVSET